MLLCWKKDKKHGNFPSGKFTFSIDFKTLSFFKMGEIHA